MNINPYESPGVSPESPLNDDGDEAVLRLDLELEDYVAFHEFHAMDTASLRKQRNWLLGMFWALMAFLGLMALTVDLLLLLFVIFVGIVTHILIQRMFPWMYRMQAKSYLKQNDAGGLLGEHELRVTERGLLEIASASEKLHYYTGSFRIAEAPGYVFIYVNSMQAHIVPKNKVLRGDLTRFLTLLRERIEAAKG